MILLVLYGPPAVGKLTVARALAEITNYRVFHSHLSFDLVKSVFPPFSPPFDMLLRDIRFRTCEAATNEGVPGMITTYCYSHPENREYPQAQLEHARRIGYQLHFVQLTCIPQLLLTRVVQSDRQQFEKLTSADVLDKCLKKRDMWTPIPGVESLRIDNSSLDPSAAAEVIVRHFSLPGCNVNQ